MTITMNITYFEDAGIRCPHCRQAQLTKEQVASRMQFGGAEVLVVECALCHSRSTIREKSDAPKTQNQTYAFHRYRK
jgi:DNA-directed RNA polymerase subunit RPC12/RpoP